MTQPIGLSDIYTEVNVLEKILGRRRLEMAELLESCNLQEFDRFGLGRVTERRVPGLGAVAAVLRRQQTNSRLPWRLLCESGNQTGN